MNTNTVLVIACDVINKACLAALGANVVGLALPPYVTLLLIVAAAGSGTTLTHLYPASFRRDTP